MIRKQFSLTLMTVVLAAFASGCADKGGAPMEHAETPEHGAPGEHAAHGAEGHEHGEPPHGGRFVEVGEHEYLVEFTHNHKTGLVTIYLYEHEGTKPLPISAKELTINVVDDGKPEQYTLAATPLESDPEGKSSRFTVTDDELLEHLHEASTKSTLKVMIEGQQYSANMAPHEEHAGADHDHGAADHASEGHEHGA